MNPLLINPASLVAGTVVVIIIGAGGGWTTNGWRLQAAIAEAKAERASEIAAQGEAALKDLADASITVKAAAQGAEFDVSALSAKLDLIRREFKNANAAPLPADCRPDAVRVRKLTTAAGATDEAIAGQRLGGAVQSERPP